MKLSGCNKLVMKSDQECSIKIVAEHAKNERAEHIEEANPMIPEESPVGEHQSRSGQTTR